MLPHAPQSEADDVPFVAGKYSKKPKNAFECIANLTLVFDFLRKKRVRVRRKLAQARIARARDSKGPTKPGRVGQGGEGRREEAGAHKD